MCEEVGGGYSFISHPSDFFSSDSWLSEDCLLLFLAMVAPFPHSNGLLYSPLKPVFLPVQDVYSPGVLAGQVSSFVDDWTCIKMLARKHLKRKSIGGGEVLVQMGGNGWMKQEAMSCFKCSESIKTSPFTIYQTRISLISSLTDSELLAKSTSWSRAYLCEIQQNAAKTVLCSTNG